MTTLTQSVTHLHFQIYTPFVYYPDNLSLLNTSGETWRQQRSVVASAFKTLNTAHVSKIKPNGMRITCLNLYIKYANR
jgi:hypothetical protein